MRFSLKFGTQMDAEMAKNISVNDRMSRILEYSSYGYFIIVAVLFWFTQWEYGAILVGVALLQYQVSQYRLIISQLQNELEETDDEDSVSKRRY